MAEESWTDRVKAWWENVTFRSVFIALVIGGALILSAIILHELRPAHEVQRPTEEAITATGDCAKCHRQETSAIVHQYEKSAHAQEGVTCLDCHKVREGQKSYEHREYMLAENVTSKNCASCHTTEYDQYRRSRHGAPAWAAVRGAEDFTQEQIRFAERFHEGAVKRPANKLAQLEGEAAIVKGCEACHDIGKPNADGTIGDCTQCHSRHNTSIAYAREPETCGQCHMGPDHAQLEIYKESKHGVIYNAERDLMNLRADPQSLTTEDMFVPTCATCHMSGLEGAQVTHNVSTRLSYWLFSEVSEKRPAFAEKQARMKEICQKCHAEAQIDTFYNEAEDVLVATNEKVR